MASGKRKRKAKIAWRPLLFGVLFGTAVLIVLVLLLTLLIYLGWLLESAIPIANTVIKILTALLTGLYIGLRRERTPLWFGGIGALSVLLLATAAMGVYAGELHVTWNLLADLLMCFAIGSAATMTVQKRKSE